MSNFPAVGFRLVEISKRLDGLIVFSADGMVLAIPLTQAAVGAVRSV